MFEETGARMPIALGCIPLEVPVLAMGDCAMIGTGFGGSTQHIPFVTPPCAGAGPAS